MAELGYYEPIPGIYGTANPATDSNPVSRAALQDRYAQMARACTSEPGYVPPSYLRQGTGVLPKVGWTAQADEGEPVFPPYVASGVIPDWTGDSNPIGAGAYDQNQSVAYGDYNPLNRGPLGDTYFDGMDGEPPNPNAPDEDEGGTIDLEW